MKSNKLRAFEQASKDIKKECKTVFISLAGIHNVNGLFTSFN